MDTFLLVFTCLMAGMTIDLTTGIENDDIQRAVAESLKNQQGILGGQVTREDEEISKYVPD